VLVAEPPTDPKTRQPREDWEPERCAEALYEGRAVIPHCRYLPLLSKIAHRFSTILHKFSIDSP
jgi:hypothetical protein